MIQSRRFGPAASTAAVDLFNLLAHDVGDEANRADAAPVAHTHGPDDAQESRHAVADAIARQDQTHVSQLGVASVAGNHNVDAVAARQALGDLLDQPRLLQDAHDAARILALGKLGRA